MKLRVTKDWRTKQRLMTVVSQHGETLDMQQITWAHAQQPLIHLLVPSYQVSGETGVTTLCYNLDGLTSLKDYVRAYQVSNQDIAAWMCDLAQVYGRCTSGGEGCYWQRSLLFQSEYVFVDAGRRMWFVFVPLRGVPFSSDNIPLAMLGFIADPQRVTYSSTLTQQFAERLSAYVLGEQNTFSFNSYRALVLEMCRLEVSPSGEPVTPKQHVGLPASTSNSHPDNSAKTAEDPMGQMGFAIMTESSGIREEALPADSKVLNTKVLGVQDGGAAHAILQVRTGGSHPLTEGLEIVLGRGSECGVQLRGNPSISRQHASVLLQGEHVRIRDLGSSNGTAVEGRKIARNQTVAAKLPCQIMLGTERVDLV